MKRPRDIKEWLSLCVVVQMKLAKHNEDTRYIAELEHMLHARDDGSIWNCREPDCQRLYESEMDSYEESSSDSIDTNAWRCYLCHAECRPHSQYCVIHMPRPYPRCKECARPFCVDCACLVNKRLCRECSYDQGDLEALLSDDDN